jgi:hypothetical protein
LEAKIKKVLNVLGVVFNSKMQSTFHAAKTIMKVNKALNEIKLIQRFFKPEELPRSNFSSILYYKREIWHLSTLNNPLRHYGLVHQMC